MGRTFYLARTRYALVGLFCAFALVLSAAPDARARDSDSDSDSDSLSMERRRGELFIADEVLDPSFPLLEEAESEDLQAEGKSDSVIEEPLDPDDVPDAEQQKVINGEIIDETDRAMERDHFDESTTPFGNTPDVMGEEFRDPIDW